MGKVTSNVKSWAGHQCLSCDFCIADERELAEALAPALAPDVQPAAKGPASVRALRLAPAGVPTLESVFGD
jgi:hypothetical protein